MIKFIEDGKQFEKKPQFGDVEIHQFFVCNQGSLWQKTDDRSANFITNASGLPTSGSADWEALYNISRILPRIVKIEY
jgi:hypothetical protein